MTLLELVNKVLRKLREDQVTDLTEEYSLLLAEFVADAHQIVVAAHDWTSMKASSIVEVAAGQSSYGLYAGSADLYSGSAYPNRESYLLYSDNGLPASYLYEAYADIATGDPLHQMKQGDWRYTARAIAERNGTTARPCVFSVVQDATNEGWTLQLDTVPDTDYHLTVDFQKPEVIADPEDGSTVILAPWYPIYLGALAFALNERGEEMGEPGNTADTKFQTALESAKEADLLNQVRTDRFEMYRD